MNTVPTILSPIFFLKIFDPQKQMCPVKWLTIHSNEWSSTDADWQTLAIAVVFRSWKTISSQLTLPKKVSMVFWRTILTPKWPNVSGEVKTYFVHLTNLASNSQSEMQNPGASTWEKRGRFQHVSAIQYTVYLVSTNWPHILLTKQT